MWHPKSTQMEERVTEDDKEQRRRKCNNDNDNDGEDDDEDDDDDVVGGCKYEDEAGNVDSGFLSGGNLQFSGEISGDSGLLHSQEEWEEGEGVEQERQVTATTAASSSSATSAAIAIEESMRAIDSGVDLDLTETLSQLSLKQVSLNPLAAKGKLIQAESTTPELLPVTRDNKDDVKFEQRHLLQQESDEERTTSNEEPWQLYYTQDDDGDTQLHIAIMQGYMEAALILIRLAPHPCLLNIYNDDWQSSLHLAVLTNQSLIVRRLILAGADPSLRNIHGNTALHLACMSGDLACAKALTDPLSPMERNKLIPGQIVPALPQNLEQRNYSGEMCLHLAATNGHVNLVRLLLRLGADLEAREALAGKTALHLAMERRCRSVVNFLLQECKPCLDTQTYSGLTAYQLALYIDSQLARELVRYGAKPEPLPDSDSESSSENNSEDETYGEASYLSAIVKMQNAVELKV
ncbi:NF-kappa-B inhibitor cactus isoform X4 [Mycetomoellerius zeteki]|uniref:NF-kappa-B inhibitor cactus isoform X4 n=1 Tax=Mycetomoellerius zeteki TaxID=64791 RepID=UPI00084EA85B|nr:PREDICTED: NF-kappa-B inhibitor cactus-like isoform X4 [Trachymyrmex zeteki]